MTAPATGIPLRSLIAHDALSSAVASEGRNASWCSRLPSRAMANATTLVATNGPGWTNRPRSSATITASRNGDPETLPPPNSSGTNSANQPRSPASASISGSCATGVSASSRTFGIGQRASMKRVVVSRNSC